MILLASDRNNHVCLLKRRSDTITNVCNSAQDVETQAAYATAIKAMYNAEVIEMVMFSKVEG